MGYDSRGRVTNHTDSLGTITTTRYDDTPAGAFGLPVGLVTEQTVTGLDGSVQTTINTLADDRKSIQATDTFTGRAERP